ncbi:MAG: DUF4214 domain-containing protein [Betaproteobacteria bacterium]|nr:DUF4214 domain-containing protein [Betaproteobacteria bacterium]
MTPPIRPFLAAFLRQAALGIAVLAGAAALPAAAQSQATCISYLATNPNPSGIPGVSGPGVSQRTNFLAAGGKLVAIGSRYYGVYIPASFYTSPLPTVVLDLHGTGGYPEAEWNDWHATMAANGVAFIALSWVGAVTTSDTQVYSDLKQILQEVGASCPIASARKALLGFSVGSAISFAVMIRDTADARIFRRHVGLSGAAWMPLDTGMSIMHPTVEAARSNATAVQGTRSWLYCGVLDTDHVWSMCNEMPIALAFMNEHGGSATLWQDPTGTHHSVPTTAYDYVPMFAFLLSKDDQSIAFGTAPNIAVGGTGTVIATATSGLAITYATTTPGTCSVSGATVTGVAVGTCTITANQGGDTFWNAATQATQSFTITATAGALGLSTSAISFGGQSMQTTSPAQAVTVTNTGGGGLTISNVAVSGSAFAQTNNCATLAAGATCTVNVTFTPPAAAGAVNSTSPATGTLTVTTLEAGGGTVSLSGTGEKSLVTHYYRAILRRASDAGGKAFWDSEALRLQGLAANVNETWYAMAAYFYFSPEYTAFGRSNSDFVGDLYGTFFNRAADAGGLAFWTGQLGSGMPREVVLVSFMFSTEFQAFTQAIFGNVAARKEVDTVLDFYRGLLSRLPDDGGFASWVAQFRAAQCSGAGAVYTTVESISSGFAGGAEYASRNRTNAQYVGDLYNAFLRRGGDLAGVQFWISQLAGGATRSAIRQQFIASPEFTNRVAAIIAEGCVP